MTKDVVVAGPAALSQSIEAFNSPLATYLNELGLPTKDILAPLEERKKVIEQLASALQPLQLDDRRTASYLTKFSVAITVGLFDGALNYLWNETIKALRQHVSSFDLQYFFSAVEQVSSRNKNLEGYEDLVLVSDHDLLEASRRIGLLSDVNYHRLEYVNYMRNHVSAAHPNQNNIDGFEMLGWLSNCLKIAITAVPDRSVISLKQLLDNTRRQAIPAEDFPHIGSEVARMPAERIDDLLTTLFGMYVSPQAQAHVKSNIEGVAKAVWDAASHTRKLEIGAKFGVYRKNGDVLRKEGTQAFLEVVEGLRYRDEDSLAGELIERLEDLRRAHFGVNNFYNEYPHAKTLSLSLPTTGTVPEAARHKWVKTLSICYIGNGLGHREGVDEGALPIYEQHIGAFGDEDVAIFLSLFADPEFNAVFEGNKKTNIRGRKLAHNLGAKTVNIHAQRALDFLGTFSTGLEKIGGDAKFRQLITFVTK